MSSLNSIVQEIAEAFGKHDDVVFKERIKFSVKYWRALLIKRDYERNTIDSSYYQTLCVDLSVTDLSDCCSVETGCTGMRSDLVLPDKIRIKRPAPFSFVGTLKYKEIEHTPREFWADALCKDWGTKGDMMYDVVNQKLTIANTTRLKKAIIKDIWFDPESLPICHSSDQIVCYDENEFPIPSEMITAIIDGIINQTMKIVNPNDRDVEINKLDN